MQISEKLRVLRQSKNLTQEELAEQLGWGIKTYANMERGKTKITFDKLEKIAQILGITLDELVEDINEKTILNYAENCSHYSGSGNSIVLTETQCAHELEKAQLFITRA
jgi:transcriptional regulator with XRE-family HTH domain